MLTRPMFGRGTAWMQGPWPFGILLAINVAITFVTVHYPTLDGPAHLYNANLLNAWLDGDATVRAYLEPVGPAPNWTDHVLLAALLRILPARLAEKALVVLYMVLLAWGTRRLIRTLAPANTGLSLLVFPLLHSHLFLFGFFNFSLGLAFMCLLLSFGLERPVRHDGRRLLLLCALATVTYFSNVLAFTLAAMVLGWAATLHAWQHREGSPGLRLRAWIREATFLLVAFLPGLLCLVWFTLQVRFDVPYRTNTTDGLLLWLLHARALQWDRLAEEAPYGWAFGAILVVLLMQRIVQFRAAGRGDLLGLPLLAVFALYLIVPDGAQAGMMNDRYVIITLLMLCLWLTTTLRPQAYTYALVLVAGAGHLLLQREQIRHTRDPLDAMALGMRKASTAIPEHAVVYPVLLGDRHLYKHLSNYLGVEKRMIILENYEARLGWFPLRWRTDRPQHQCLPGPVPKGVFCTLPPTGAPVDAVVVHGDPVLWEDQAYAPLRAHLDSAFTFVPEASGEHVRLYLHR